MKFFISNVILLSALSGLACQSAPLAPANAAPPTPAAEKKVESLDDKLRDVQRMDFNFVYAFRRKDGGALDGDDRRFLRANAAPQTNQWVVTEEGRVAIAGSNYLFPPEGLENLKNRFDVTDYSKK